ncbi:hypothetical protein ACMHYB_60260 [Sorangium sp. So ce1128]
MRVSIELKRSAGCVQRTLHGSSGYFAFAVLTRPRWPETAAHGRPQPSRGEPKHGSRIWRIFAEVASLLHRSGAGRQPSEDQHEQPFVLKDWCVALTSSLDGASKHEGWDIDPDEEWEMEVKVEPG